MDRTARWIFAGLMVICLLGLAMYVRSERLAYQAARGAVVRQALESAPLTVATEWPGRRR
jgi:hypothetical protein